MLDRTPSRRRVDQGVIHTLKPRRRRAERGSKKRNNTKNDVTLSHAARQQRYADRIARNSVLVPIEITERRLAVLIALRHLDEADHEHGKLAIKSAIERLLDDLAAEDDA